MHGQRHFGIWSLTSCNGRQSVGTLGVQLHSDVWSVCRAKFRPFHPCQHEHRRIWLNHQLTSALTWWLEILSCSPPRVIPTNLSERRRIVSYSDGEGSEELSVQLYGNIKLELCGQGSLVFQKRFACCGIVRKIESFQRHF